MLGKRPDDLLSLEEKETTPLTRKLDAFTEKIEEDIKKKRINEVDGQRLILQATMVVSMFTKT